MAPAPNPSLQRSPIGGLLLRVLGAALLVGSAAIHLDLYVTGYKHIPTIGPLFLLQAFAAFALAVGVLVSRQRLASILGAVFALSTLAGYILTLWVGLFNFTEVRTTAGIVAGILEIGAFLALGAYALFLAPRGTPSPPWLARARRALVPVAGIAVVVFAVAVSTSSGAGTSPTNRVHPGSTTVAVSISNFAFFPSSFTVNPGETVVVTNHDSVDHTLTATSGANFTTGNIAPGTSESFTAPLAPGSYPYDCAIHNFMTGTLTVR